MLTDELDFARRRAEEAGEMVRRFAADGYQVGTKSDRTVVTTADTEINRWFIEEVLARFPQDGVLGEEASRPGAGPRTWVIDPIDGTRQFLLGIPVFMVSIALVVDGRPVVGVAVNPSTRECYSAVDGQGAHRDGRPLRVSARDGAVEPLVVGGSGALPSPADLTADTLLRVTTAPEFGSTAHRYPWPSVFSGCKVAEGVWDADLYASTGAHDVAAVCVLVREAGGTVTDRHGADQRYDGAVDGCVLSNGRAHDSLVRHWAAARAGIAAR